MLLIHANYLDEDFRLVQGDIEIEDGKILRVGKDLPRKEEDLAVDCAGSYTVVPGFVDVHIHGCAGADTCDATREALEAMAAFLLAHGVTSFCPTTMTTSRETIQAALLAAKDMMDHPMEGGARVVGEQPGGLDFVEKASQLCTVSIAHTTADYDQAKAAFDKGVTHATHLFNAMSGLHHRKPGVVGAVFDDSRVRGELICDGFHIHPAVLRAAFRLLGDRALIVSDSMRANGMPEGEAFDLGGQMVTVHQGKALLPDGTIAGSVTNLHQEIKNLVSFGVPFEQAVKAATLLPARAIGLDGEIGSIAPGKRADLVVLDENLDIAAVYH